MNLSGLGSLLGTATQFLGAVTPLGALGSLASSALGGSRSQETASSDPFSAIMALTKDVDGIASGGLAGGLLGSVAGMLA